MNDKHKQETLEHLLRQKKERELSSDEKSLLSSLDKWAQRRVIFACTALATGIVASLLGVSVERCIALAFVAGGIPWLALVYQWR